jgi:hypothetical protein
VVTAVLVTVLVSAALAEALAVFAGQAMPQAVHRELATASGTSVLISGPLTETGESAAVRAAIRSAWVPCVCGVLRCPFSGPREEGLVCPALPSGSRAGKMSGRIRASGSFWCTGIPPILPQTRILPGNPGIRPGSRPARTTRRHRTRPPGGLAAAGPEQGDQTRTVASIVHSGSC